MNLDHDDHWQSQIPNTNFYFTQWEILNGIQNISKSEIMFVYIMYIMSMIEHVEADAYRMLMQADKYLITCNMSIDCLWSPVLVENLRNTDKR